MIASAARKADKGSSPLEPTHILAAILVGLAWLGYVACLRTYYWTTISLTVLVAGYFVAVVRINPEAKPSGLGVVGVAALIAIGLATRRRLRRPKISARRIVIDGTNVMHWDGGVAKLATLRCVVDELAKRGFVPVVFLDASSRHHLKDKSLTESGFAKALGLPQKQVMVCPAGTEADEFILKFANQEALPILSNDRFGDRSALAKDIKTIKGVMTDGQPIFDGI